MAHQQMKVIRKKGFGPRETQVALGVSRDFKDSKDTKYPRLLSKLTCKCSNYLETPQRHPKTSQSLHKVSQSLPKVFQRLPKTPKDI
jgi:hypothetical protein